MCYVSGPKFPAPEPPPKIEMPEPIPAAPVTDVKQQSQAAPATSGSIGDQLRRRMRSRLTISSAIGTPGMGA